MFINMKQIDISISNLNLIIELKIFFPNIKN